MGSQETYWQVKSYEEAVEFAKKIGELPENRMSEDLTFVDGVGFSTLKADVDSRFGFLEKGSMFLVVSGERHPFQDRDESNPLVEICGTMPIPLEDVVGDDIDPSMEHYVPFN